MPSEYRKRQARAKKLKIIKLVTIMLLLAVVIILIHQPKKTECEVALNIGKEGAIYEKCQVTETQVIDIKTTKVIIEK